MDEHNIRDPDSVFKDCLMDTEDTIDEEIQLALNISLNEYNESYINNIENVKSEINNLNQNINSIDENSNFNEHFNEHLNEHSDEHFNEHSDEYFDQQIKLALEISQKEHEDEILRLEEEEKLLNIVNRKKSLEFFSNIIKKLSYTKEDIKLKNKIMPLLDEYYSLNIDVINLDKNTYTQLYNIIDLYYLIPNKKGNITKITKEEDELIRSTFLEINQFL